MAEIVILTFLKPDGSTATIKAHSASAAQQRAYYERKGFAFINPGAPEPEPAKRGPGRPPKSEP